MISVVAGLCLLLGACGEPAKPENQTANEVAAELARIEIRPGLWQVASAITDVRGEGLPVDIRRRMVGRRGGSTSCITPEQARRPDARFLSAQGGSQCTYRDFAMESGRLRGTTVCTGGDLPGRMINAMDGRYTPNAYTIAMTMRTEGMPGGADLVLDARVEGRRLGDCPAR